ncbi:MAG: hypothetical protein V3T21_02480 [Candidatus Margulisiibacteriota bacterium]
MKKLGLILIATLIFGMITSASALTVSPKFSYIGYLGIGCEFSPLTKITPDVDLMAEVNWDFVGWAGSSGYIYGELNAVYNAKPFKMGEGKQAMPLDPYVGGGLIYGFPMGSADWSGSLSGGIGFAIFGGVTGKMDPYTWYGQLKYGYAPLTWKWSTGIWGIPGESTHNALGVGMEWGVRFPL